jgi:orotidine-5'-phosphate decarboxylase
LGKQVFGPRLIIALDFDNLQQAYSLVEKLEPARCRLKVGKEVFTKFGPTFVERLVKKGFDVFLDLKFHDIPHTVAKACQAAAELGVWMVNVHALGGQEMLRAAREAIENAKDRRPLLIAVTLLTSLVEADLPMIGLQGTMEENVLRLARLAKENLLDGVVCSALEGPLLRSELGKNFYLVTPGIRLKPEKDDQKRTLTPREAIDAGSDYLVVGRPITRAENPLAVITEIENQIAGIRN